jgi:hypothetical protein
MKITNRSSATTIYRIPEDHIKRKFAPGETKFDISEDEIRKLSYSKGGLAILKDNLLIDDKEVIAKYISDSVEPEYWFTEKEIKDLMLYGELDRFLDCLDFAPEGVIDIIKSLAISLPLTDTRKIEAIKDKTGFNVANALAAIATVNLLGVDVFQAAEILQDFSGTKRRLEVIGTKNGITLIDDFAHNPDKVKASVSALRKYTGRLIVIFQPHGFGPMRSLGKEIMQNYAKFLSDDDIFVMPEIFFVGGTVTKDISSEDFINYIKAQGKKNAYFFADWKELEDFVVNQASEGDRIIVMGARDNSLTDFCYRILERV